MELWALEEFPGSPWNPVHTAAVSLDLRGQRLDVLERTLRNSSVGLRHRSALHGPGVVEIPVVMNLTFYVSTCVVTFLLKDAGSLVRAKLKLMLLTFAHKLQFES